MGRVKTDRQVCCGILVFLFVAASVLGVVFYRAWELSGAGMFLAAGLACAAAAAALPIAPAGIWALRNRMDRGGPRYMWRHYWLVLRLRKQLLEAGVYTVRKIGAARWAAVPWVTAEFAPDFKSGRVYIENSIRFHDKLGSMDISPSLGRYVVEQAYLTDSGNHYYFDFYDSSLGRKMAFGSFEEFRAYSASLGAYELFVDSHTRLPLTHQLIAGQTGSGKTYALHGYILQMLLKPVKYCLYFADPKGSSIALLGERVSPGATASSFEGIAALLETFTARMHGRQRQMKGLLSGKIDGDYRDFGLPPHVLVFDEFADFSLLLQTKDKKLRERISHMVSEIVLKGRQQGFFLWVVMQQAGSNNIPTFVRDNLPWKVVLGNAEDQTYNTAFGAGVEIPRRKMAAGDGVYTYPAAADKPRLCSFPALGFDVLEALGARVL